MSLCTESSAKLRSRRALGFLGAGLWCVALAGALIWMTTAGFSGGATVYATPTNWPADVPLLRDPARCTLVLLVHPKCPCTEATLAELERVLSRSVDHLPKIHVVAAIPAGAGEDWTDTATLRQCRRLPDAKVTLDPNGTISARLRAISSGTVLVYDIAGRLQYAGGITASSGHEGDNVGADSVVQVLNGEALTATSTRVFGCRLVSPADAERNQGTAPQ